MDYDWENIFENKTNKELYDIVVGKVVLSNEAILYARKELERRNFDFDNMEVNNATWRFTNLIEQEHYSRYRLKNSKQSLRSFKAYLIIIGLSIIGFYLLDRYLDFDLTYEVMLVYIGLVAIIILINNYSYRSNQRAYDKIASEIEELKNQIDKEDVLSKNSVFLEEVERHRQKEEKANKLWSKIVIITSFIMLFIAILKIFNLILKWYR